MSTRTLDDCPNGHNASATLADLAKRARASHRRSISAWMETAEIVVQAHEVASHGAWGLWCQAAGIPERTARRMVRIASEFETGQVAALGSVQAAEEWLARRDKAVMFWEVCRDAWGDELPDGAPPASDDEINAWATFHDAIIDAWEGDGDPLDAWELRPWAEREGDHDAG